MPAKAHVVAFAFLILVALRLEPEVMAEEQQSVPDTSGALSTLQAALPALHDEIREIRDGFSSRVNVLGFGVTQQPVDSPLNSDNRLQIPRYQTELHTRPDFRQNFRGWELSMRPRLELRWRRWEDGSRENDDEVDANFFVNEWLVRYGMDDKLFVSYGRENLQWGPSYLLSPSNPFNRDNGQNNPRIEVPGLDYGRLVWLPSEAWAVSFIANTDEGRQKFVEDFDRAYALKLDYTGEERYGSLIASHREDGESRLGFFGGWSASQALLLYTEGSVPDEIEDVEFLLGSSYTLVMGPTISVEFFHREEGCTVGNIARCFAPGVNRVEPTDFFFRKNYLLVQYTHTRIKDTANLILRWVSDLDDGSGRIISIFDYELGDHVQLFSIASGGIGGKRTELGSLLEYSLMLGMGYTF